MRIRIIIFALVVNAMLWGALEYRPVGTALAQSGCAATYVVQPGDYLSTIAEKFNVTQDSIVSVNGITHGRFLTVIGGTMGAVEQSLAERNRVLIGFRRRHHGIGPPVILRHDGEGITVQVNASWGSGGYDPGHMATRPGRAPRERLRVGPTRRLPEQR